MPLVSQSGRSCLVQAPQPLTATLINSEVKFNTEVVLYSAWDDIK